MRVVTSFNEEGYHKYGRKFLDSFLANWPKSVELIVYYHDFDLPADIPEGPVYRNLNKEFAPLGEWRSKYAQAKGIMDGGRYDYRFDAYKFSHKVFAIADATTKLTGIDKPGWLVWLDADTITTKPVDNDNLVLNLPTAADIVHLGRRTINYSETSFIAFNLDSEKAWDLIADMRDAYLSGEMFSYAEWHDGFVFERLLNFHRWHGLTSLSLSDPQDLDAFNSSPLGAFMQHFKGPKKDRREIPVKIFPVNAAEDETIIGNIKKNTKLIKKWLPRYKEHDYTAVCISAGPTLEKYIPEIKDFLSKNKAKVFCVKHALPTLLKHGIVPFGCVLLDARPFKGISTHGFKRQELLAQTPKETVYFTASMVDPAMVRFLLKRDRSVVGWHAYTAGVEKLKIADNTFFVVGGTCAAVRMISLAHVMGFKKFHLWGYDSCFYEEPDRTRKDDKGRPYYMRAGVAGTNLSWWTTGELMSQTQDLETLWKTASEDMELTMHGEGLGAAIVANIERPKKDANLPAFAGEI